MTNPATSGVELPEMDLLRKFDVPAPRYTSYPTADRFNASFGAEDYRKALAGRADAKEPADLSLYVHVPFCNDVCFYCGCNKIVTRDHSRSAEYIEMIGREADLVKEAVTGSTELEQLHFGGGTPTFLTNDELTLMMETLTKRFPLAQGGEFSIEVDPRTCDADKVKHLHDLGLNRMSLGVQDFNPDVQKAVNRIQPFEMTKATMEAARENGFESINMDLIYGLPKQNRGTFEKTIDQVLELSPDRIALYHYAHLPNHFKPQRRILPADLPDTVEKVNIMFDAIKRLTANGYRYIGMDHFAKETDELSVAQKEGSLQRNFQGYSTKAECDMIALGVSSISKIGSAYACNPRELEDYYAAIREGRLATNRGYLLNADDEMRRYVIMKIMCNFELRKRDVEERFGIKFDETFAYELGKMKPYVKHELVELYDDRLVVSAKGKIFVRAVAMHTSTATCANPPARAATPASPKRPGTARPAGRLRTPGDDARTLRRPPPVRRASPFCTIRPPFRPSGHENPHSDRELQGRTHAMGVKYEFSSRVFTKAPDTPFMPRPALPAVSQSGPPRSSPSPPQADRPPFPPPAGASRLRMQLHGTELTKTYRRWNGPDQAHAA